MARGGELPVMAAAATATAVDVSHMQSRQVEIVPKIVPQIVPE